MTNKIVDEKVVSYKMAERLKEAGFDERVLGIYMYTPSSSVSKGGYFNSYKSYVHHSNTEWQELFSEAKDMLYKGMDAKHPYISAPTYCQVLDWLQERHQLYVYVTYEGDGLWTVHIRGNNVVVDIDGADRYKAYETAFIWILRKIFNLKWK